MATSIRVPAAGEISAVDRRDLTSNVCSRPLSALYGVLSCQRRWRIGRVLLSAIMRMEKGPYYSRTARELMHRFHDVSIGAYSYGSCFTPGVFPRGSVVGRYTSIAWDVRVFTANHPLDYLSTHPFFYDRRLGTLVHDDHSAKGITIGHDVWLGAGVITTPGCRYIGTGAVVGAGSVVTKNVPDFAIVAGNPARILRYRFDGRTQEVIRQSHWWDRPLVDCMDHSDDMRKPVGNPSGHPLFASRGGCVVAKDAQ